MSNAAKEALAEDEARELQQFVDAQRSLAHAARLLLASPQSIAKGIARMPLSLPMVTHLRVRIVAVRANAA